MTDTTEQKYTIDELKQYVGKTIMFEVEVDKSGSGEDVQFPILMVSDVKQTNTGSSLIVGINLMRLRETKYNMVQEKAKPYRSYKIDHIKYGSIKLVLE